jgi:hypothetical protein
MDMLKINVDSDGQGTTDNRHQSTMLLKKHTFGFFRLSEIAHLNIKTLQYKEQVIL